MATQGASGGDAVAWWTRARARKMFFFAFFGFFRDELHPWASSSAWLLQTERRQSTTLYEIVVVQTRFD
jgi:hypothetical protein